MEQMRYPAVPLVNVDPFFSIWSMTDTLYGDVTRHWTGRRCPMSAAVTVDGKEYYLMGEKSCDSDRFSLPSRFKAHIPQRSVKITPTRTVFRFANEVIEVTLTFTSPLIVSRPDVMSRPVAYLEYDLRIIDGGEHTAEFYFDISTESCTDSCDSKIICEEQKHSIRFGKSDNRPLHKSGDSTTVDWGYIHVADRSARLFSCVGKRWGDLRELEFNREYAVFEKYPYLIIRKKSQHGVIVLAYDDVYSIEYFGEKKHCLYRDYFSDFDSMLECAIAEYSEISSLCNEFDKQLTADAMKLGAKHCELLSLAYRQAVGAHKAIRNSRGELIYLAKECHSNGCIGTLDCTYEGAPLFLKYNPNLVIAMLRPIAEYAESGKWKYEFCPHDVGQYPLANGQAYGVNNYTENGSCPTDKFQMPLEECGNILICTLAAKHFGADADDFTAKYQPLLRQYADYLVKYGYDPTEQLCTDDFTGRLGHGCNLSLKSIMGIACYAALYSDEKYMQTAKNYAKRWINDSGAHRSASHLTLHSEDGWSTKYNIIWDKIFGFGLFNDEILRQEVNIYLQNMDKYGTPLDSRANFNVPIWFMWTAVMTDSAEYKKKVIDAIWSFYNDTVDRVPMSDWNRTDTNESMDFQHRSVIGGLYINLLL